jgi:UDP-glucose 4-epimerase
MKTALITGVAGFLGRYVARQFAKEGWRVIGIDELPPENAHLAPGTLYHRMHLPSESLGEVIKAVRPSACIHCAGRASVQLSIENPSADFAASVDITFSLLETLRSTAPKCRTLFLSSAAVYGNPTSLPIAENHSPLPISPYGYHKRICEFLCEEFARMYGLPTCSARIFSAYGPGLRRQVIWDICQRILCTGTLELHGTGDESRDFIHASDIARALTLLVEHGALRGEVYNVASGNEVTIREVANTLSTALLSVTPPKFDGVVRVGDPLNWRADISKLLALGYRPTIPLEQGLRSVATWAAAELAVER